MKLFNKQAIALLVSVITINVLCVISVSYAYYTADVSGGGDLMTLNTGTMKIKYTDGNAVTLDHAIPGDSVKKQFKIENIGDFATSYNIKLNIATNTFKDKTDLKLTLKKKTASGGWEEVFANKNIPASTGENYIAINRALPLSTVSAADTYELTVLFENKSTNQQTEEEQTLSLTVDIDSNQAASLASGF